MNEEARDVLRAAALRGHPQVRGAYHSTLDQGECAIGVLHLSVHKTRSEAVQCLDKAFNGNDCLHWELVKRYNLSSHDMSEIIDRNDRWCQDFLTIANKTGVEDTDNE